MLDVSCEHCGRRFDAADELRGGITNCPHCGRATSIEGLRDPLWRGVQAGALGLAVVVALGVSVLHGPLLGAASGLLVGAGSLVWFKIAG